MTPREKFIMALEGKQPPGRVPHWELVFYPTMEALGKVHPEQRAYHQWGQMSETERECHRQDIAQLYVDCARKYEHSGIMFHCAMGWRDPADETRRILDKIRDISGDEFLLLIHGDPTLSLPGGNHMMDHVVELAEKPQEVKDRCARGVEECVKSAERHAKHGALDGFAMCADYCFNDAPFLSPAMFDEFVTPYLTDVIVAYRKMGFYVIKHTDGNIMPILDSLVAARPHALHSIDPQGHVDIAEVKRLVGDKVCLIGNVNCGLLQTGTDEEVIESARYCLKHGMPGGGYVFSTSNCIYTGMAMERYELILDVWRREGNYAE
ncbi:MAG: uroporphyrinogen decarboxylase family protein [Planctomycetota bacterium]